MENYASEDELDCFRELEALREKYKEKLKPLPIELERIDKGLVNNLFHNVISIVKRYSKIESNRKEFDIKKGIEDAKRGDFISREVLKPIFETLGEGFKTPHNWNKGYCPFCGMPPLMAYLRKEDGKRILTCILCKTEWEFLRIKCIGCQTEDLKYLRFFEVDESGIRVDVCDNCKFYIKTLDKRKVDFSNIEELDIKTRYLDILASNEGYTRQQRLESNNHFLNW